MKELALKIRLVDEVSSAMNNIGDSGTKVCLLYTSDAADD